MGNWTEYSDKFNSEHPDLIERRLIKVEAQIVFEYEAHSDNSNEELVELAIKHLKDGSKMQIVLKVMQ